MDRENRASLNEVKLYFFSIKDGFAGVGWDERRDDCSSLSKILLNF